jgi:hypothetical protein
MGRRSATEATGGGTCAQGGSGGGGRSGSVMEPPFVNVVYSAEYLHLTLTSKQRTYQMRHNRPVKGVATLHRGTVHSTPRALLLAYSPKCLEEVFSDASMQDLA